MVSILIATLQDKRGKGQKGGFSRAFRGLWVEFLDNFFLKPRGSQRCGRMSFSMDGWGDRGGKAFWAITSTSGVEKDQCLRRSS